MTSLQILLHNQAELPASKTYRSTTESTRGSLISSKARLTASISTISAIKMQPNKAPRRCDPSQPSRFPANLEVALTMKSPCLISRATAALPMSWWKSRPRCRCVTSSNVALEITTFQQLDRPQSQPIANSLLSRNRQIPLSTLSMTLRIYTWTQLEMAKFRSAVSTNSKTKWPNRKRPS